MKSLIYVRVYLQVHILFLFKTGQLVNEKGQHLTPWRLTRKIYKRDGKFKAYEENNKKKQTGETYALVRLRK